MLCFEATTQYIWCCGCEDPQNQADTHAKKRAVMFSEFLYRMVPSSIKCRACTSTQKRKNDLLEQIESLMIIARSC